MLDERGQSKQTFFETFARTALRERSILFIVKAITPDDFINFWTNLCKL